MRLIVILLFVSAGLSAQVSGRYSMYAQINAEESGYDTYTEDWDSYADNSDPDGQGQWNIEDGAFQINNPSSDGSVHGDDNSAYSALYYDGTFGDDQYAEIVVDAVGSGNYIGVSVRCSGGSGTYYSFYCNSDACYLSEVTAGSGADLDSDATGVSVGDTIRLEADGTDLKVYVNGSAYTGIGTNGVYSDASISSGYAGVAAWDNGSTARGDQWEGGTLE